MAEHEALQIVAADVGEKSQLGRRFDAFGGDATAENAAEGDDGINDRDIAVVARQLADEAAVDLDRVDWQMFELRERTVARPEVIDCQADPHLFQFSERATCRLEVVHENGFGQL